MIEKHVIEAGEPWKQVQWVYLAQACPSKIVLGACFPESCSGLNPIKGSLKYSEISKCHKMMWKKGSEIKYLQDHEGKIQ